MGNKLKKLLYDLTTNQITMKTHKEFINDVADLFVMLEGVTEELRAHRGDERTVKIIKGSLDLLKSFRDKYASQYESVKLREFKTV